MFWFRLTQWHAVTLFDEAVSLSWNYHKEKTFFFLLFFSVKVVKQWNSLPKETVGYPFLEVLKTQQGMARATTTTCPSWCCSHCSTNLDTGVSPFCQDCYFLLCSLRTTPTYCRENSYCCTAVMVLSDIIVCGAVKSSLLYVLRNLGYTCFKFKETEWWMPIHSSCLHAEVYAIVYVYVCI